MNSAESNFLAWLRKADHDLLNIENNLAAKEVPWDTICFHAQQAVEKVLKAFLLRALEPDCRKLTSYGVAARYPDDLFEPSEEDGREVVAAAYRVREEILTLLPKDRQASYSVCFGDRAPLNKINPLEQGPC